MEKISIALWVENFSHEVASLDGWLALVRRQLDRAAREGCDLLMLPEHNGEHWMHFAPPGLAPRDEVAWMGGQMRLARPRLQAMARETGVALLSGSTTWSDGESGAFLNRGWLFFPDRAEAFHDKLVMTPFEKDPDCWTYAPGDRLNIVEWRGLKIGFVICLDSEMPMLSHLLAREDIDLLLVPSQTGALSGYNRVFSCCRARAVELFCPVAVVGCTGAASKNGEPRDGMTGGAAVYAPAEAALGGTGVLAELAPHAQAEGEGKMLVVRDIPVGRIRALRRAGGAEAWPGSWDAGHVRVRRGA